MEYMMHNLVAFVPFMALATVGIALLCQHRTVLTALIAFEIQLVALSYITNTLVGFYAFGGRGDFGAAMNRVGWTLPVTHWGHRCRSLDGVIEPSVAHIFASAGTRLALHRCGRYAFRSLPQ